MGNNLLIVDDDQEVVEIVSEILKSLFSLIETAHSVEEATSLLSKNTYTLILLDINLGSRNGAEVLQYLNTSESNPNKNIPVIILSGIMTTKFINRFQNKFSGLILKPFEHDSLISIVKKAIDPACTVEEKPNEEDEDDIPFLKCNLPFPVEDIENQVSIVLEQVKKSPKLKQLFGQLKINRETDNFTLMRISLLINISTSISFQMKWNTDKTLEKFVFAAYLHNMTLKERPDLAKINSLEKLEGLEYKLVFEHPNDAALIIEKLDEIPADVAIIIKQHHELPNENGFPAKCGHRKITPLSSIFIFAHDLADYIIANPVWNIDEYLENRKSTFKGSHFTKIIESFSDDEI